MLHLGQLESMQPCINISHCAEQARGSQPDVGSPKSRLPVYRPDSCHLPIKVVGIQLLAFDVEHWIE